MAKKQRRAPGRKATAAAQNIGAVLGTVVAKVNAWMAQREELARELRNAADRVMAGANPFGPRVTTPSMLKKELEARGSSGRRKRFTVSAAKASIAKARRKRATKAKKATRRA